MKFYLQKDWNNGYVLTELVRSLGAELPDPDHADWIASVQRGELNVGFFIQVAIFVHCHFNLLTIRVESVNRTSNVYKIWFRTNFYLYVQKYRNTKYSIF